MGCQKGYPLVLTCYSLSQSFFTIKISTNVTYYIILIKNVFVLNPIVMLFYFLFESWCFRSYLCCISHRESAVHLLKVTVEGRTVEIGRLGKYICQTMMLVYTKSWFYLLGLRVVWLKMNTRGQRNVANTWFFSHTWTHRYEVKSTYIEKS